MRTKNQLMLINKILYGVMLIAIFFSTFGTSWNRSIALAKQEKGTQSLQLENTSLYTDKHFGFSFQYPKGWILENGKFIDVFDQVYQVRVLQSYMPYIGILVTLQSNPKMLDVIDFVLTEGKGRELCQDCPKKNSVSSQVLGTLQGQATKIVGYPLENSVSINFVVGDAILTLQTIAAGDGFPLFSRSDGSQIALEAILADVLNRLQLPPISQVVFSSKPTLPNQQIAAVEIADSFRFPTDSNQRLGIPYGGTNSGLTFNGVDWSPCFQMKASVLLHAGDDLKGSLATEVKAVANGQVSKIMDWSPGKAVVISHILLSGETIYSFYAHLNTLNVSDNPPTVVHEGDVIGRMLNQGSNTHTHWEMRNWSTTTENWCPSGSTPLFGSGYTPPGVFPDSRGYKDPTRFVKEHIPAVILYENANYQGRSLALTQTDLDLCDNPLDSSQPPVSPCFSAPSWTDAASSIKVMPGYKAILHIHNQADADKWHDDATRSYSCNSDIPDFQGISFPNGTPLNDNVSRVIIEKCGSDSSANSVLLSNSISMASTNPCSPEPPPPSRTDNASFISDITIPDSTTISPNQSLTKTWRMKNTGSTTWGSGYQLAFLRGDRLNAPAAINVPSTTPGQTVDLSVAITGPNSPGSYKGYWRMRNAQGTYFGPEIWVAIKVLGTSSHITLFQTEPTSPATTSMVRIHARVDNFPNLRAVRVLIDGAHKGEIGGPEIWVEWNTTSYQNGSHSIVVEAASTSDLNWTNPESKGMSFVLQGNNVSTNHAPKAPSLITGDWAVYPSPSGISLAAQQNGDPDGDAISQYYFEIFGSHDTPNSGWINSNVWSPPSLGPYGYQWHVKVKDSAGAESDWSETRHFNVNDPNPQIYSFSSQVCRASWNQGDPDKICFCAQTNAGTLLLQYNTATDGSESGIWKGINELGTPNYSCNQDSDSPPTLDPKDLASGTHRVRLYARRDGGWAAAKTQDITISVGNLRPNGPGAITLNNGVYVNSQNVTLAWQSTQRTSSYRIEVSQDSNFASHLVDQTLISTQTSVNVSLPSPFPNVYWKVTSNGPYGTNYSTNLFHIDITAPDTTLSVPSSSATNNFLVNWSGSDSGSGIQKYQVQVLDQTRLGDTWSDWLADTIQTSASFVGQFGHTYLFRVRGMDQAGNWQSWPTGNGPRQASVPVAPPPAAERPDLVIQNMSAYANPDGGVNVTVDVLNQGTVSTTIGFYTDLYLNHLPTGAQDYNGSLRFWVNDPIPAGGSATLTTVITDSSSLSATSAESSEPVETSNIFYAQTDSAGTLAETDKQNNIYASGVEFCVAERDAYPFDQTYDLFATHILPGESQIHNFDQAGDQDWLQFTAEAGEKYILKTSAVGTAADTYLYLYDSDGTTLISSNDDFENTLASQIEWTAPNSATYYALIKSWNPNVGGCGTTYSIELSTAGPDTVAPSVSWFGPTTDGQVYDVKNHIILLSVNASDNVGVKSVSFSRWDYVKKINVPLGTIVTGTGFISPYEIDFDTRGLLPGWNEIDVDVQDEAGNSSSSYIFLNNTASSIKTFFSRAAEDGTIVETSENSNVGGTINSNAITVNLGDDALKRQYRSILSFNTSSLPDTAVITSAILKVKLKAITGGGSPVRSFGGFLIGINTGPIGSSILQATDFQLATNAVTPLGPFILVPTDNWYSIDLTNGKTYINKLATKNGLTQLRLRFKLDDNNNTVANYLNLYSGNAPADSRPQLVIAYFVP